MTRIRRFVLACAAVGLAAGPVWAAALGSDFTFQGELKQAGVPFDGTADFDFSL